MARDKITGLTDRQLKTCDLYIANYLERDKSSYTFSKAMEDAGYSKTYINTNAHVIRGNARVQSYLDAKRTEFEAKTVLTIQSVLDNLSWAIDQAKDKKPPDLAAIARLSELQGKYLSMFSESGNNAATGLSLNFSTKVHEKAPSGPVRAKTIKIG